ncbi:MAG: hypothetical protein ACD_20C00376G0005 [uncultured bacterium]|nr:MAG: hypothetical protein ACD_20C00376G0005 [uncultured bacterium]
MFRVKSRKRHGNGAMRLVRGSVMTGSSMMARGISGGMKNAARLGYVVGRNPILANMAHRIQRKPMGSVAAVIGLGMAVFGIINLIRR